MAWHKYTLPVEVIASAQANDRDGYEVYIPSIANLVGRGDGHLEKVVRMCFELDRRERRRRRLVRDAGSRGRWDGKHPGGGSPSRSSRRRRRP